MAFVTQVSSNSKFLKPAYLGSLVLAFVFGFFVATALSDGRTLTPSALLRMAPRANKESTGHFMVDEGKVITQLEILNLDYFHQVLRERNPERIFVEIGVNSRDSFRDDPVMKEPGTFLISIEPLMDKYAYLLSSEGPRADARVPLGFSSQAGNICVLPLAISPDEGLLNFNVADVDGCSSLSEMNDQHHEGWPDWVEHGCTKASEKRSVPAISLYRFIDTFLERRQIEYLKVDAQGLDLEVFLSAGNLTSAVKSVSIEVISDKVDNLYANQRKCSEVMDIMTEHGFKAQQLVDCNGFMEIDILFSHAK